MFIKLLDRNLIRRFNNSVINVDTSIAEVLISKKLAVAVDIVEKAFEKPPIDKMIKFPDVKKTIIDNSSNNFEQIPSSLFGDFINEYSS